MTHSSKDKLNAVHLMGSIGTGAVVGVLSGSVTLCLVVTALLIAASLVTGEIRMRRNRHDRNSR